MKQLTFGAMAAKRFTVVECEPINRVKTIINREHSFGRPS